ncbi:MAG: hypothetical protein GX748_10450, partial [Lentisphaerae bacterium]|nr:hypothetical protein [Lentisphaerota bacterium]
SNWVLWQSRSGKASTEAEHNRSTDLLLGEDGRDNDIFMSVADTGQFQSPGELGFIVRPFNNQADAQCDFSDTSRASDATLSGLQSTLPDAEHMFRTIRLYDHGGTGDKQRRDDIYEHFYVADPSGALVGARVNPLSDIPYVLEAAIGKTPLDYWISANRADLPPPTSNQDYTFNSYLANNWNAFADGWFGALVGRTKTKKVSTNNDGDKTIAESFQAQMRDVYGLNDTMGWYQDDPQKIFNAPYQFTLPAAAPLHEVDRKTLYSFSLDSFCDRQQLFLYVLRAEVTSPTLFSSATEARSLAGGRAVALVWRDPYPAGYDKEKGSFTHTQDPVFESDYNALRRVSPWVQHNRNQRVSYNEDEYGKNDPVAGERRASHHAHRILFFKQLDK